MDAEEATGGTGKDWVKAATASIVAEMETKVASPAAVDAYKTYLYRKGNKTVAQIESVKAGHSIDLTELIHEIKATEKTIEMCEYVGFQTYEEQYKLKGLMALYGQLVGKTWPSLQDIHNAIKKQQQAEQDAEEKWKQKKAAQLAEVKAQLQQQIASNGPKWVLPQKNTPGSAAFVHKFQKLGGPWKPILTEPVKVGSITQEWIMLIGFTSGLNVTILHRHNGEIALKCKVCSKNKHVDKSAVSDTNELAVDVEQFCRDHRHEATVPRKPAGRLFRDED